MAQLETPSPKTRLVSLDALRGFDMFWILGADVIGQNLGRVTQFRPLTFFARQLEHKDWAGFASYDLIFPLFVFTVGVSLVFSITQIVTRESRSAAVKRIIRRAIVLFLLGIFYNGGLTHPWPEVRLVGVLQRISLAYLAAGLLFLYFKPRVLAAIGVALLVGYWALLAYVPIRDFSLEPTSVAARLGHPNASRPEVRAAFEATTTYVTGRFEPGLNLTNHLDFQYLPGSFYDTYYDPEGFLSTFPAIVTCLGGVFAGLLLRRSDLSSERKVGLLVGAGVIAVALGWAWHPFFPVIKKIWSSSFVLVAGGWSLLLLAAFYYVVDVKRRQRWCVPFIWIGMNPITLYLVSSFLDFHGVAERFAGGSVTLWFDRHLTAGAGGLVVTAAALGLVFALAAFLYRKKIFLRV
ncbi:MAG TPA: DUF5009 domain-containing protein [Opitutaceae bacterium]|nr:DUF5009 domain-containing protein [Opitutaceae bacterium]